MNVAWIIHYLVWITTGFFVGKYLTLEYLVSFCEHVLELGPKTIKVMKFIAYIPLVNLMVTIVFFLLVAVIAGIFYTIFYLNQLVKGLKR